MSAAVPAVAMTAALGERRRRGRNIIAASAVLLAAMAVLSLSVGATGISLDALPRVIADLFTGSGVDTARERLILFEIRLPRTLLAMFIGTALAVSGAMMQGLFRNPLADPGVIGVSAGAALAAVCVIALGHSIAAPVVALLGIYAVPIAAFIGGMAVTMALVSITARHGQLMIGTLLLAGIAIAALAQSLIGLVAFASDDRALRDLTLWTLGSLAGASWAKVLAIAPFGVLLVLLVPRLGARAQRLPVRRGGGLPPGRGRRKDQAPRRRGDGGMRRRGGRGRRHHRFSRHRGPAFRAPAHGAGPRLRAARKRAAGGIAGARGRHRGPHGGGAGRAPARHRHGDHRRARVPAPRA